MHARPLRERAAGIDARHLLPRFHRFGVAVQPREHDAQLEQRLHLLGVELQGPPERFEGLRVALVVQQRPSQQQQRRQVVGVLLEHLREPHHGLAQLPRAPQQVGQRERRLVEGGERIERPLVRLLRGAPVFSLFVQPAEVHAHLHVARVELERRAVRGERALLVADLHRHVTLELVQVGASRRPGLRLLQRRERPGRVARGCPSPRDGHQRVHVVGGEQEQLLRQRVRLLGAAAAEGEQRLHLAEARCDAVGLERARLAVALQRLAVQTPLREDVPEEHGRIGAAGAPLHRAHRLRRCDVHQPLAHVVARQCQRVFGCLPRRRLGGGGRRELLEDVVQQPLIEIEVLADRLGRHVRRNLGGDPDRGLLVLEVDREREFLRDVVRIELQGALGGTERPVEVAEVRQGEAQVVVRARVRGVRFHRPHERVARVRKAFQLHQHQPDAVPGRGGGGLARQHLAVRLERQLEAAQLVKEQRQVEARRAERPLQPQGCPKRLYARVGRGLVRLHHTEVVPGERVVRIHLHRLLVGGQRVVGAARLVQHDPALVPQLG